MYDLPGCSGGIAEHRVGNRHPSHHIESVFPSHLYIVSVASAMRMEVGQQYIVTHPLIYVRYWEHSDVAVFVSMYEDGRISGMPPTVYERGMLSFTILHDDECIAQCLASVQTVYPWLQFRILFDETLFILAIPFFMKKFGSKDVS